MNANLTPEHFAGGRWTAIASLALAGDVALGVAEFGAVPAHDDAIAQLAQVCTDDVAPGWHPAADALAKL